MALLQRHMTDVVEIFHNVQKLEDADIQSISSVCFFLQVHYVILLIDLFFFFRFILFMCFVVLQMYCLHNEQSIL